MGEGNSFSLLVCPHPGVPTLARSRWGMGGDPKIGTLLAKVGTPQPGQDGGEGYPNVGTPRQVQDRGGVHKGKYPLARMRGGGTPR